MEFKDLPKEKKLGIAENLSNKHFGMLTPLYRVDDIMWGKQKKVAWACKCDCGNYCVATAQQLKNGSKTTCAEHEKCQDITGENFGHLTAIYPTEFRTNDFNTIWYCTCDCGGYVYAPIHSLRNGDRIQCNDHFNKPICSITVNFPNFLPIIVLLK